MRVLHVIPGIARRYGGPSYAVAEICKSLRSLGVEAEIATTDADGSFGSLATSALRPMFGDVPIRMFHRDIGESLKYSRELGRWLPENVRDYDVVHIHSIFSHASVVASKAAARLNVPFIVRPLGHFDPWSLSVNALRKKVFLRCFCGDLLNRAAFFHYTTVEEQRLAASVVKVASFVAPLGVDEALFAASDRLRPPEKYVLSLGRLHPKKNLDVLIRAFAAASNGDRAWRLRIAGEGENGYVGQLKDVARASGVGDRVDFVGWIDGAEKIAILQSAAIFALPSSQENFGLSTAEAMAAGVPVLVTEEVNLSADVISGHAGWTAKIENFADMLRQALADPAEREKRGRAARALASEKYRWASTASTLREVYDRVRRISASGSHV
jgi:glycosyltransferase involved in cell wall biosynthesis